MKYFPILFIFLFFIQCGGNDKDDSSKKISVTKDKVDKWDKTVEVAEDSTTRAVYYLETGKSSQIAEVTWINKTVISVKLVLVSGKEQTAFSAVLSDVPTGSVPQIFVDEKGTQPIHSFMQQNDGQQTFIRVDVSVDKKFIVLIDWTTNGQQELRMVYNKKMLRTNSN